MLGSVNASAGLARGPTSRISACPAWKCLYCTPVHVDHDNRVYVEPCFLILAAFIGPPSQKRVCSSQDGHSDVNVVVMSSSIDGHGGRLELLHSKVTVGILVAGQRAEIIACMKRRVATLILV